MRHFLIIATLLHLIADREMRNIDVLFLIEHVDRELDAVTCIVERLERQFGISADVRNFYSDMRYCLRHYNPMIVATPFCYFLDHHPMKDYVAAWPHATYFNMAWEQILYKMHEAVKIPKDAFARTQVHHVCWTRKYFDLVAGLGVGAEKLHLTGNPVMKFYDSPYNKYFKSRQQLAAIYRLDSNRKWVLFPENYRFAFLTTGQMQSFVAQNANPEHITTARNYCIRSLSALFDWLQGLDGTDDPLVIVRPRPATAAEEMREFMSKIATRGCPNVHIIKGESARDWILAADHVVSSYSTTLIESSLAGKPIHIFSPEPFPEALVDDWYDFVPRLETREGLMAALRDPGSHSTSDRLNQWARQILLPAGDPLQAIAETVARLHTPAAWPSKRSTPDRSRLWAGSHFTERMRNLLQSSPRYHQLLRKLDPRYAFASQKHEKDVFGAHDVAARVARWRELAAPDAQKL